MSLVCSRCGKENDPDNRYCARCGLELSIPAVEAEEASLNCYKHPREGTNLRCGRCDRPICHKCVVISPAGTRCRECSKSHAQVRPMGILHDISLGFKRIFRGGPMSIYFTLLIVSMLAGLVQTCRVMTPRSVPRPNVEEPVDRGDGGGESTIPISFEVRERDL